MIFYSLNEVLAMAIKIEENGYQIYSQLAKENRNEKLKELFNFLAIEEWRHKETFQNISNKLKTSPYQLPYSWEEVQPYLAAITDSRFFTGEEKVFSLIKNATTEEEIIELALAFEKETLLFYYEILNLVAEEDKPTILKLINEEKNHIKKLKAVKGDLK
jgi:rubrerythrin